MKLVLNSTIALCLCMLSGAAYAAEVIKVGVISNFTGPLSIYGSMLQKSIEAYQGAHGDTLKASDGSEVKFEFIYRDSGSAGPEKAKQLAEELVVHDRVKFLLGLDTTPQAIAVAAVATEAKVPTFITLAAASALTRASPYFVRLSMTIPQYAVPVAKWAYKNNVRKAVTLVSDFASGHDAETYFFKAFKEQGGEIVASLRSPLMESNYSVYMEKILMAKPDAIYVMSPGGSVSIALLRAYIERGLKAAGVLLIAGGETQELYLPSFGDDAIGTISSFPYTFGNSFPENVAFRKHLTKVSGEKAIADVPTVAAWDATDLLYEAVTALGPKTEGIKYIEFLKGKSLNSPRGPIQIDPEERDVIQNVYVRRVEKQNGKLLNVDIDTTPMVKDPWKMENPARK